ncbi:DEAD/DEAH box helicase family protein [Streptomyces sp. NPDC047315]|uniref:DEAD/DEAH box helicase family protein n=1 Tax=Streptomyces sp. NPDC047315 TaxID=3155142 RepID=UPI0033D0CA30
MGAAVGAQAAGGRDPRILGLAAASVNFGFLLQHLDLLVLYGAGAEASIFDDPNIALFKSRQFGEAMAADLVRRFQLRPERDQQTDLLRALAREGVLHGSVGRAFDQVRLLGNRAAHQGYAEQRAAFEAVKTCFRLGVWFDRLLTGTREHRAWIPPKPPNQEPPVGASEQREFSRLNDDYEQVVQRLADIKLNLQSTMSRLDSEQAARDLAVADLAKAQADQVQLAELLASLQEIAQQPVTEALGERKSTKPDAAERDRWLRNAEPASREPLTEAQVRVALDRMLADAGWAVQNDTAAEVDLTARRGVALREVTVGAGRADYLLYVNEKLVGVIEAKREGADLTAAESQADGYAQNLTSAQRFSAWRQDLPFRYASDGGTTRFRNTLDPDSRSRRVFSFHRPETLSLWIREAEEDPQAPTFRAKMRWRMPELDTSTLRPAQIEAVTGLEQSLAMDKPRALIQMATGAGKTYTAVTFSHRLAKYANARKILFLVDRNNLGAQAEGEFNNYVIPGTRRKFPEEYNVQRLSNGAELEDSTKVVVSTVQRLWLALAGKPMPSLESDEPEIVETDQPIEVQYNKNVPPETFDLIIVDECHRSIYGQWRNVLEYFDAHLVGLTATPVSQTFGFFDRNLVSEYTFEQAVADNVNVDFDVYRIHTKVTAQGSTIPSGVTVPVVDRRTRRQKYEELDEDMTYRAAQVGASVMSKDQMRLVIKTFRENLYSDIFPERAKIPADKRMVPKTLVFARNDLHADEIVQIIREEFGRGNDFCKKITHKAEKTQNLISDFRNSAELRIAVTVDMIATGTDVKPLECLVFLRDVRSWAYFEQMKGRGARTISRTDFAKVTPDVGEKVRFVIVDAVGVTENPKVDAAPLDRDPVQRQSLEKLLRNAGNGSITPDEVSTLAARLARLDKQISEEDRLELEKLAGVPLRQITRTMVDAVSVDAQDVANARGGDKAVYELARQSVAPLAGNKKLRERILEIRRAADVVVDEVTADKLLHAGAVVIDRDDAESVITSWRKYVQKHQDEILAFQVAYADRTLSPREVFGRLKEIARRLERPPHRWTPEGLWRAYEALDLAAGKRGVKHGPADLVSIIRFELGLDEELRPYREVIEERFAAWALRQEQAGVILSDKQRWWLEQIAEAVAKNVRFDTADLDHPPFTQRGGTDGYLADFGEEAAVRYINELDQELSA